MNLSKKLLLASITALTAFQVHSQDRFLSNSLRKEADGVLALLGYAVVPDITASSLSIEDPQSNKNRLFLTQFAGGRSGWLSKDNLYLEGSIAYLNFDPSLVGKDTFNDLSKDLRWNAFSGTGGVGWDIQLRSNWTFRPIVNVSIGHLKSSLNKRPIPFGYRDLSMRESLGDGTLTAMGLGGSLMLDYSNQHLKNKGEIDAELRYTNISMWSIQSSLGTESRTISVQAASAYLRYRAPLPINEMQNPMKYVLEAASTFYLGDQRGLLGFTSLNSVGLGLELNTRSHVKYVNAVRVVGRYAFGQNVKGFSIGLAFNF